MASGKEIRSKIRSVQNTQKITRAMEMVAASKMRRAQERMAASRPYAENIRRVIGHLAHAHPEYHHTFMAEREAKRVGIIVVSTDRGLAGGLNANLFRTILGEMQKWRAQGAEVTLGVIGQKALGFFRRFGAEITAHATHLGDTPRVEELIGACKVMIDAYNEQSLDRVFLAYNEFVNTMTQRPQMEQVLPIPQGEFEEQLGHVWDYIYEPEARDVLDQLLQRYLESLVYQSVVENIACEQAARMVAMKAASDNAGNLIGELQLAYNKARQAAITQELSEIVAGAAAV